MYANMREESQQVDHSASVIAFAFSYDALARSWLAAPDFQRSASRPSKRLGHRQ
jgi:hypothetical protein